jgi:hypothetical protein
MEKDEGWRRFQTISVHHSNAQLRFLASFFPRLRLSYRGALMKHYQRPTIHFAPRTVSQTATSSTVSTMTATSRAIKSRSPSSSR